MIFPKIQADKLVQINDGLRLDARKTIFRNVADIENIEISPLGAEGSETFISVYEDGDFDKWFLDWQYSTPGNKRVVVRVTTTEEALESEIEIEAISPDDDKLFSTDQDIILSEPDILRYLPSGKTSYNFMHRESQKRILGWLDEKKIWKSNGERFTKDDIVDMQEFKDWSRFLTLHLIFSAKIVKPDDFFDRKASDYQRLHISAKNRGALRLDTTGDGEINVKQDMITTGIVRR